MGDKEGTVIQSIYGAAVGATPWSAALDELADYTDSRCITLDTYDLDDHSGEVLASNMAPHRLPCESDLVNAILTGQSLRHYADQHEITFETARTHAKNATRIVGWRRQGKLITMVMTALSHARLFDTEVFCRKPDGHDNREGYA